MSGWLLLPSLSASEEGLEMAGGSDDGRPVLPAEGQMQGLEAAEELVGRLAWEARRCQRYNLFCSLMFMSCRTNSPQMVYSRVKRQLRATDYTELVHERSGEGAGGRSADSCAGAKGRCRIAAILPETDARGARIALDRLRGSLRDIADLKLGFAVYPDDGSDASQLLQRAVACAAHTAPQTRRETSSS